MKKLKARTLSERMARIRKTNTKPELVVRRLLHRLGYRFRLYSKDLPGSPDIVFSRRQKVIFVHGCFWHRHNCSLGLRTPKANQHYWVPKLARNKERDSLTLRRLAELGWDVEIVWECEVADIDALATRLLAFLH